MRKLIGHIGVDAGLCWIGDPCYILHGEYPTSIGKSWEEFCDIVHDEKGPTMKQFNYNIGSPGLGVCVSTGLGDGFYPVYAEIVTDKVFGRRIGSIHINFMGGPTEKAFKKLIKSAPKKKKVKHVDR